MTLLLSLFAVSAGLAAVVGITLVTVLALRNPCIHGWIRSAFVAQAASFVLVAMITGALAWAMASMMQAGLHFVIAAMTAAAVVFASGYLFWLAFGIGERLRLTDAGRSPFEAIGRDLPQTKSKTPAH